MEAFDAFAEVTLIVPELWTKDWDAEIDDEEGIERELGITLKHLSHALKNLQPKPVSPEKLAVIHIWSRLFGCVSGVLGAVRSDSRITVAVLARTALEAAMQLQAIMFPLLGRVEDEVEAMTPEKWSQIRGRLVAFTAWAMRGDQTYYQQFTKPDVFSRTFDPKPEREFIKRLGPLKPAWENLSGQSFEVVSDQEAFFDRAKAEEGLRNKQNRLTRWLMDTRLQPWIAKLKKLEQDKPGRSIQFFELIDAGYSMKSLLKLRGLDLGYSEYMRGSGVIHGSSFEAPMVLGKDVVAPDFADISGDLVDEATRVNITCRMHAFLLAMVVPHLDSE